jgi:diphosphomevalonate decarboxylase
MKTTVIAPSNIAFIKYWGKKDEVLRLPENGSISMTLDNLLTKTSVEFSNDLETDEVWINGEQNEKKSARVIKHLDRVRKMSGLNLKAKVESSNNFPTGTGLSSSASGLAALSLAASKAAALDLNEKELSILARQGSGSACRSIPSGFVQWLDGDTSDTSYATTIFDKNHWDIADVVAVVNQGPKDVSTTEGMQSASSSNFYQTRLNGMTNKLNLCRSLIEKKDFTQFGDLIEAEALELHAIMLTSHPSLIYLEPASIKLFKFIKNLRKEGLEAYFTVNTGQDVHIICQRKLVEKLVEKLSEMPEVKETIVNFVGDGARVIEA